jgi:hypothetical protein
VIDGLLFVLIVFVVGIGVGCACALGALVVSRAVRRRRWERREDWR